MRRRNRGLTAVPLGAVAELRSLSRHVERLLPAISIPALVLAGAHDHTVTLRGVRRLAARLGSGPAPVEVLPGSAHLLAVDVDRERCADEVLRFIEGLSPKPPPGRK